jgi:pimeloyl-ACP methyl ester carboxylesterase
MSNRLFEAAARAGIPVPPPPHDDAMLAELATRVFCHPLRGRRPPREDGYLATARRIPLPAPAGELAAWQWGDEARPLVLLVHGWEGRGSQLGAFAAPLVSAGFKVVAFDAPAHGDSPGDETNIRLLTEALQTVVRLYGPLHAVIGHSWGAAGAAMLAAQGDVPRVMVLLAPPLWQKGRVERTARRLGLSEAAQALFLEKVRQRVGWTYEQMDMRPVARSAPCPLLVFHDPGDEDTAFVDSQEFTALWTGSRLVPCPGRGHYRILVTAEVINDAVRFIAETR